MWRRKKKHTHSRWWEEERRGVQEKEAHCRSPAASPSFIAFKSTVNFARIVTTLEERGRNKMVLLAKPDQKIHPFWAACTWTYEGMAVHMVR